MEWPLGWMWASLAAAAGSLVVPWFLPPTRRRLSLLVLACALIVYTTYELIVQSRARQGDALIRVDLFLLLPLLAAGAMSCVGAALNRQRS